MLNHYLKKFTKLRTDKNRQRWSSITCHQAPHNPFLLLSVMDHFAQGIITQNFIEPSFDISKHIKQERNFPGHILTLSDREIFKPKEKIFGRIKKIWSGTEQKYLIYKTTKSIYCPRNSCPWNSCKFWGHRQTTLR